MDFVDRGMELQLLDDLYQRAGAQLLILYGRRRVGKTRGNGSLIVTLM